jgi:hypothetical protein
MASWRGRENCRSSIQKLDTSAKREGEKERERKRERDLEREIRET